MITNIIGENVDRLHGRIQELCNQLKESDITPKLNQSSTVMVELCRDIDTIWCGDRVSGFKQSIFNSINEIKYWFMLLRNRKHITAKLHDWFIDEYDKLIKHIKVFMSALHF